MVEVIRVKATTSRTTDVFAAASNYVLEFINAMGRRLLTCHAHPYNSWRISITRTWHRMSRASAFPRQSAQPIENRWILTGFKNCQKLPPNQRKASKQRLHKTCRNSSVQAFDERTALVFLVGSCGVTCLGSQNVRFVTLLSSS